MFQPALPSETTIRITYYALLTLALGVSFGLIITDMNDPFGELLIALGIASLLLVPLLLRFLFGFLLRIIKNDNDRNSPTTID